MRIAEVDASILLSDDGRAILAAAGVKVAPLSWLDVDVVEAEEMGLRLRLNRAGVPRALLLRWDYILSVDVPRRNEAVRMGLR